MIEKAIPSFLIVGHPRSGTTLVQRLACELAGVRVPPETHFFERHALGLLERQPLPLCGAALRGELERYATAEPDLQIDVERVMALLEGRCERLTALFGALVHSLAGPARCHGEKTPAHLAWWRPLTAALPELKLVVVVRDPRAVVASCFQAFGRHKFTHVARAFWWQAYQRALFDAAAALGPARCLILHYEAVARDAGAQQRRLGEFLGVDPEQRQPVAAREIYLPHEIWKHDVLGPIELRESWSEILSPREAREIMFVCHAELGRLGYPQDVEPVAPPSWEVTEGKTRAALARLHGAIAAAAAAC